MINDIKQMPEWIKASDAVENISQYNRSKRLAKSFQLEEWYGSKDDDDDDDSDYNESGNNDCG